MNMTRIQATNKLLTPFVVGPAKSSFTPYAVLSLLLPKYISIYICIYTKSYVAQLSSTLVIDIVKFIEASRSYLILYN